MISEKELADLSYPGAPKFDSSELVFSGKLK